MNVNPFHVKGNADVQTDRLVDEVLAAFNTIVKLAALSQPTLFR